MSIRRCGNLSPRDLHVLPSWKQASLAGRFEFHDSFVRPNWSLTRCNLKMLCSVRPSWSLHHMKPQNVVFCPSQLVTVPYETPECCVLSAPIGHCTRCNQKCCVSSALRQAVPRRRPQPRGMHHGVATSPAAVPGKR
jgi:hypothetical protein